MADFLDSEASESDVSTVCCVCVLLAISQFCFFVHTPIRRKKLQLLRHEEKARRKKNNAIYI